ncbi:transposase [Alcaligenaceae bacterium]|nr:transposase [Alcaligenaceae bacterium]
MDQNALKPHRARRGYTDQFKAEMVAECLRGNVSVASLALEQGMNANVLRRWIVEVSPHRCL